MADAGRWVSNRVHDGWERRRSLERVVVLADALHGDRSQRVRDVVAAYQHGREDERRMTRHEVLAAALMRWREAAEATGAVVPSVVDLRAIASNPSAWPADVDTSTVEPWRATLEWLIKQWAMGVTHPEDQLPTALRAPRAGTAAARHSAPAAPAAPVRRSVPIPPPPPPPPPAPSARPAATQQPVPRFAPPPPPPPGSTGGVRPSSETTSQFDSLKRWVQAGLARNPKAFSEVKDRDLKTLLASGNRSLEWVAANLPPGIKMYAAEVVELLAAPAKAGADAPSTAAPSPAPATPAPATPAPATPAPATPAPRPQAHSAPERPSVQPPSRQDTHDPGPEAPADRARDAVEHEADLDAAAGGSTVEDGSGLSREFDPTDFADFDYSEPIGQPGPLTCTGAKAEAIALSWAAPTEPAAVTVYRVVSGDEFAPYAPDRADLVAVTTMRKCVDSRPFTTAVRYFQVWRNEGEDVDGALGSQPRLHAAHAVVSPVMDVEIREDEGRVIGQWRAFPGVRRVQVFRIPIERAAVGRLAPEYRILAGDLNLGGFVDATAERGRRYLYQAYAEVDVEGIVRLSAPRNADMRISAVLVGVSDLTVRPHGGDVDAQFDLTWTEPPAGRVVVFRTKDGPRSGADAEARQESVLPSMGLDPSDRLSYPINPEPDGGVSMRDVPWPAGWPRTYFTPVTILDGMARVGTTTSATLVPPVREAVIVERVHRQVVTFAWPKGAAKVVAHEGPVGGTSEQVRGGRRHEISAAQYTELGGLGLPVPLPSRGCALHLVPVAFDRGDPVEGAPTTLAYPGLLRMAYRISIRRGITGRPTSLTVSILSEVPLPGPPPFTGCPPFVLVHNAERLPLDVFDGHPIDVTLDGDETLERFRRIVPARLSPTEESATWKADVKDRTGFVRLFVDLPPAILRQVALLDPPARNLRLEPLFGGR